MATARTARARSRPARSRTTRSRCTTSSCARSSRRGRPRGPLRARPRARGRAPDPRGTAAGEDGRGLARGGQRGDGRAGRVRARQHGRSDRGSRDRVQRRPAHPHRVPEGTRDRQLMVLAALAAFAGAAVQSASSLGFALVLSPALFAVMDPEQAVTAVLLLGAALCVLVLIESHRVGTYGLARLLVPALPGLAAGVVVLAALSK